MNKAMRQLIFFHLNRPILGHSTFLASYATVIASWVHLIPPFFAIVGSIAGGTTGVIILIATIYGQGGFKGIWYKATHFWKGEDSNKCSTDQRPPNCPLK